MLNVSIFLGKNQWHLEYKNTSLVIFLRCWCVTWSVKKAIQRESSNIFFLKTAKCITLHVHGYESARSVLKIGELCGNEVEEEREDEDWTISRRDAMAGKIHIKWFQGPDDIRNTTQTGYVLREFRINWLKHWQVLLDDGTRHTCTPATWSDSLVARGIWLSLCCFGNKWSWT